VREADELQPRHGETSLPDLLLKVRGAQGDVHWFHNETWLGTTDAGQPPQWNFRHLEPGMHRIAVQDAVGKMVRVAFRVRAPVQVRPGG
jgi:membrane carboxypeptidase/penicillin-binding protein PbpC